MQSTGEETYDMPLVVVHSHHRVKLAASRTEEDGVGRDRSYAGPPTCVCFIDCRLNDTSLVVVMVMVGTHEVVVMSCKYWGEASVVRTWVKIVWQLHTEFRQRNIK